MRNTRILCAVMLDTKVSELPLPLLQLHLFFFIADCTISAQLRAQHLLWQDIILEATVFLPIAGSRDPYRFPKGWSAHQAHHWEGDHHHYRL